LPTRFRHKGSAYGAAGTLTTPFQEIIHTQASSHLADFGGYGTAHSENFSHRNILRFDRARTEVTGSQTHPDGPTYSTLVKATVEGLNIMGMITADCVVANLVSTYVHGPDAEPAVNLIGSRFENLKIAGIPVKVSLNLDVLDKYRHHKKLKDAYKTDKTVRDLFGDDDLRKRHATAPAEVKEFLDAPPSEKKGAEMPHSEGVSVLSIVRKLEPEGNAFECFGHVIHIEGFGTIRLGEVRICNKTRELTMVQVRFGCPVKGHSSLASVEGGGSPGT
jgi:hypothetical protein